MCWHPTICRSTDWVISGTRLLMQNDVKWYELMTIYDSCLRMAFRNCNIDRSLCSMMTFLCCPPEKESTSANRSRCNQKISFEKYIYCTLYNKLSLFHIASYRDCLATQVLQNTSVVIWNCGYLYIIIHTENSYMYLS